MKPMLAASVTTIEELNGRYPFFASPKLDGIRAIVIGGVLVSRNLKPIPNAFIQAQLPLNHMEGIDGELIVGKPYDKDCFRTTTSGVMSADGEPDFAFYIFDRQTAAPFGQRFRDIKNIKHKRIKVVPQVTITDSFELHTYEEQMLERGFEGVMLRLPSGKYKEGRSTLKEGWLMKLKRFCDSEAVILGFEELMHNNNEKTLESGGKAKRSSHKAGLVPMGCLGNILVRDIISGVEFGIGSGFTQADREMYWATKEDLKGKLVKYKYFPTGSKDKPRFPVFISFRHKDDM